MDKKKKGKLIVLSGPSGAGKSTVISELLRRHKDIHFSVSFTTRQPREGETNGIDYYFVDRTEFKRMISGDELLEFAEYVDNYYGTSLKVIQDHLEYGIDVLLDIEVQGASKVKAKCPEAVSIFLIPPSLEELSRRLHQRGTDSERVIQDRLQRAKSEYKEIANYDYLVVNDDVQLAVNKIISILNGEELSGEQTNIFN